MEAKIEIEDNCIRKTLYKNEWSLSDFNLYRELSSHKDHFMKVISWISPTQYTTEKLDILCDVENALTQHHRFSRQTYIDIYATYNQIYLDSLELSKNRWSDKFFMHRDLSLNNVVITKQNKVMLIDEDSFSVTPDFMPWKYFNNLQTVAWLVNKRLGELNVSV